MKPHPFLRVAIFCWFVGISLVAELAHGETRVINYPGTAFRTSDAYQHGSTYVGFMYGTELGNYYHQKDPTWITLYADAHIPLPAGTRIKRMSVHAVDVNVDHVISYAIVATSLDGSAFKPLCSGDTIVTSGDDWQPDVYSTPCDVTLESSLAYSARVVIPPGGNQLFVSGASIEYETAPAAPPPGFATFGDIPVGHPLHRFVEALYRAGVSGGCGGSNFCADAPITRGQLAVFLSQALGLGW